METRSAIVIRSVQESDLAAYREIRLEALHAHPAAYGSDYAEQSSDLQAVWADRIRASIEGTMSRIFLAEDYEQAVGLSAVYREKGAKVCHSATLVSVYVRPAWRGRRIAEQMIDCAADWCASVGVRILRLTVVTTNAPAIRCYARCGFVVYGIQPEVIRVGTDYHDELMMWRRVRSRDC